MSEERKTVADQIEEAWLAGELTHAEACEALAEAYGDES